MCLTDVLGPCAVCSSEWRIWNQQSRENIVHEPFKALFHIYLVIQRKMLWVMHSAVGLWPERSRFDLRPVCVGFFFLVDEGTLGQVCLQVLPFFPVSITLLMLYTHVIVCPQCYVVLALTLFLTLCRSNLKHYCMGRKAAFFSVGI